MQPDLPTPTLQLIQPNYCLIRHLPSNFPEHLISSHQMIQSPHHQGYVIKLNMLNSLKRFLCQLALHIPSIPNVAFKMYRPITKEIKKKGCLKQLGDQWGLEEVQLKAIRFYTQNGGRIIIGDDWAMGKTVTALAIIEYTLQLHSIIICPHILIDHWAQHIFKYFQTKDVIVLNQQNLQPNLNHKFIIISYQLLQSTQPYYNKYLTLLKGRLVVCDEAQMIAEKQMVKNLLKVSEHIILMGQYCEKWLLNLIPIVNTRIEEKEIMERYEKMNEVERQFNSSILKYYFIKSTRRMNKPPVLVKPIILKQPMNSQQAQLARTAQLIYQYTIFLIQHKSTQSILLIYLKQQLSKLLYMKLSNYHPILQANVPASSTHPLIIITKLQSCSNYFSLLNKQSIILFAQLLQANQANDKAMLEYTNKLFLISQRIEYIIYNEDKSIPKILFDQTISSSISNHTIEDISDEESRQHISDEESRQLDNRKCENRVIYFDIQASGSYIEIEQSYSQKQAMKDYQVQKLAINLKQYQPPIQSNIQKNQTQIKEKNIEKIEEEEASESKKENKNQSINYVRGKFQIRLIENVSFLKVLN